jgi:hypothetical protein
MKIDRIHHVAYRRRLAAELVGMGAAATVCRGATSLARWVTTPTDDVCLQACGSPFPAGHGHTKW